MTPKVIFVFLIGLAVGSSTSFIYLHSTLTEQRVASESQNQKLLAENAKLAELNRLLVASTAVKQAPPAQPIATSTSGSSPQQPLPTTAPGWSSTQPVQSADAARVSMKMLYGDLIKALHLDNATELRFLDLLNEYHARLSELSRSRQPAAENQALATQMRANMKNDLLGLLGNEKYAQYEKYERYQSEYNTLSRFRSQLASAAETMLSEQQERKLVSVLIEEADSLPIQAGMPLSGDANRLRLQREEELSRRVLERVQPVLSAAQFELFRIQQEQRLSMMNGTAASLSRLPANRSATD